ncbi:MAG: type 4a pilus biogenesis protein PilO [Bryobacteraceae bacterium]|nr:type 4a pilus biogenesis protein PilO [Bryobacteraceae bacterium]
MPANFSLKRFKGRLAPGALTPVRKDPRVLVRIVLGALLAANIVAALILFKPWAPSAEEMDRQVAQLRQQVNQTQASIERLKVIAQKVLKARQQSEQFMQQYFLDRRTASSTLVSELKNAAQQAGIQQKEQTFSNFEPIEGSDTLSMLSISVSYEGAYENLVKFINHLDRSPRFLILDTLSASPQRSAGSLTVNFKMNAFVLEPLAARVVETAADATSGQVRSGT